MDYLGEAWQDTTVDSLFPRYPQTLASVILIMNVGNYLLKKLAEDKPCSRASTEFALASASWSWQALVASK
jgi:hypothetical protein